MSGSNGVARIEIDSVWGGLGAAQETQVDIRHSPDGYRRNGAAVPDKAVNGLIAAIHKPALDRPTPANLGIDQAFLNAHSVPDLSRDSRLVGRSPAQFALYKARLDDPKNIAAQVAEIYSLRSLHTDDYPRVTVTISFDDGSVAVIESLSQTVFMLPWTVTAKGREITTYDADIARAVSALLPPDAANARRVSGAGLGDELSEALLFALEDDWNLLDTQSRAPASIALLKSAYDVRTAEINDRNGIAYFVQMEAISDEAFDATLSRRGFPANLTVALELPFGNGRADGIDRFLKTNVTRENLVLSVPWLMQALRRHADMPARLVYVHGASLSESALAAFEADMHALGKDELAGEVAAMREHAAVLITGASNDTTWIVLPDRRSVLWHYRGHDGLLDWTQKSFPFRTCKTQFFTFFGDGGCSGALISASGAIER